MRFFAVSLLLLALMLTVEAQLLSRQRRRLDQLGKMIMATTGRHYASFIGYGSFCGKGGSGVPVDKLDACCELHDKCFSKTKKMDKEGKCGPRGGPIFSPYLSKYEYRDNGSGSLVCLDDRSTDYKNCLYELCQCDKVFAECLRPHKDSYDPKHLKESQKVLRDLVKVIETTPNVADWIWEKIDKLMQRV